MKRTPIMDIKFIDIFGSTKKRKMKKPQNFVKSVKLIGENTEIVDILPSNEVIFHQSDKSKECTMKQLNYYKDNWKKYLPKRTEKYLKKHPKSVLHGGHSINMILTESELTKTKESHPLYRETHDYDLYVGKRKLRKHAKKIEEEIDKSIGCDICEVVHIPIPVTTGVDDPTMSADLYRIVTKSTDRDSDIDLMQKPKSLKTQRYKGITHEKLESQYEKIKKSVHHPMRWPKASMDIARINKYWRSKGKK